MQPHRLLALKIAVLFAAAPVFAQTVAVTAPSAEEEAAIRLDDYKVTAATRTEKLASALPVTTTVISSETLDSQLGISGDLGNALAQFIPSYAPARQKLTSNGESFRGRDPLYLLDGIPQSNPLRAGKRESLTIDPFFLEKVEAVHGSSAAQGLGATGGIINFVTRQAPATDGVRSTLELTGTSSTRLKSDGTGGKAAAVTAVRSGAVSMVAGATAERKPFAYDGDGRPLGVDNVQGDTLDSDSYDMFVKAAYELNRRLRVELMVNHFDLEQNPDWIAIAGNRSLRIPTSAVSGTPAGLPAENKITSAALTFTDRELLGGELTFNLFSQDFSARYGASDTAATRNSFRLNGVPTLDQSQVDAEKHGLRTTWVRTFAELGNLGVVTGFDYLADETAQILVLTGRTWVPYTTYSGWSPYVQLEKPFGALTLSGGVRYEFAELQVDDFTTIESAGNTFVRGGNPTFEEPLLNVGANWRVNRTVTLFGGFAQGFGMADVGRILRAINTPNKDVDDFINLNPVVTDNWEAGARIHGDGWRAGWSVFYSTSKLGSRLVANAAGIYSVARERTEIYGTEITGEKRFGRFGTLGGYLAVLEGKSDRDGDGRVDHRLPAANITAPKLAIYWDKPWTPRVSTRLQSLTLLNRDDPDHLSAGDFHGYTLIDLLATWRATESQTLSIGIENALDQRYIGYFSQTLTGASADDFNNFAGRGRTATVRWRYEF